MFVALVQVLGSADDADPVPGLATAEFVIAAHMPADADAAEVVVRIEVIDRLSGLLHEYAEFA